jgi:hypothetical protein
LKPGFEVRIYPIARFSFLKQTLFADIQPGFCFVFGPDETVQPGNPGYTETGRELLWDR